MKLQLELTTATAPSKAASKETVWVTGQFERTSGIREYFSHVVHDDFELGKTVVRGLPFPSDFHKFLVINLRIGKLGAKKVDGWLPSRLIGVMLRDNVTREPVFDKVGWKQWFDENSSLQYNMFIQPGRQAAEFDESTLEIRTADQSGEGTSTGPIPIKGVPTSNAAILGQTERGPENVRLVTSWREYQAWFGGFIPKQSFLADAVQGFFENGGRQCFVARITGDRADRAEATAGNLRIAAIGKGQWGNRLVAQFLPSSNLDARETAFNFRVMYFGSDLTHPVDPQLASVIEDYENLTHRSGHDTIESIVNSRSKLVRLWPEGAAAPPSVGTTTMLTGGADSVVGPGDYAGKRAPLHATAPEDLFGRSNGLVGMEEIDEISLVVAPDEVKADMGDITKQVIRHCSTMKDRFGIISITEADRLNDASVINVPENSSHAAFYHPWIQVHDLSAHELRAIPATGHVAGVIARTDIERGVHKAPANEVVRGAVDVEVRVNREQQGILSPKGVNCIRDFSSESRGIRVWGARTMSADPEWRYISVRRLHIFIQVSIEKGIPWAAFEPNDERLWASVRRTVFDFLIDLWRNGALPGTKPDEAFFVRCDRTTMNRDDLDNGRLVCLIGIAPVRPAEFVILRIVHKTRDAQSDD